MIGKCQKCGEEKALAMYRKEQGGKRYYRPYCTQCWNASREEYRKAYQLRNKDKLTQYHKEKYARTRVNVRAVAKRYYRKLQADVFAHYGNRCVCCGESNSAFLSIDHVNNDGAAHRKEIGVGHILFRWIIENNYPDTLQLLCCNCNLGKHRNGGICPHHNAYMSQSDFRPYNPLATIGI